MSMEKAKQYCIQNAKEELSILEGADFSQLIPTDMLFKIMFHTRLADMNGVLERLVKEIHPDARIRSYKIPVGKTHCVSCGMKGRFSLF